MEELLQVRFKGQRDDVGVNYTSPEYLRFIENGEFPDIDGVNKSLMPEPVNTTEYATGYGIDGGYEYKYLDSSNILQTEQIVISGGKLFSNALVTPVEITDYLTANNKCSFCVQNDKLFISNGSNYPLIYWGEKGVAYQMGAPAVTEGGASVLSGEYYYALSYVTTGGEEVVGTISNVITVVNKAITVNLPLPYAAATGRKIYRTAAGGTQLKLVATIGITETSYSDTVTDASLGVNIPAVNNEMIKPKWIDSSYFALVAAGDTSKPTQIFTGGTGLEVIDPATYSDVSNVGNDNSPIIGMEQQFSQIVAVTEKNWYLVDTSGTTVTVTPTSTNIGGWDGFSLVNIPANEQFPGGVMFLSTLKDIRVLNGLSGLIPNTINNIESQNWAQVIKGSLDNEVTTTVNVDAIFFNYTYHLLIGSRIFLFNVKNNQWSTMMIRDNDGNVTTPRCFMQFGEDLYIGRNDTSKIERMYSSTTYNGIDYTMTARTASIPAYPIQGGGFSVTRDVKFFDEVEIYFVPSLDYPLEYKITIDDDQTDPITGSFNCPGGVFDDTIYDETFYDAQSSAIDYRVVRIHRFGTYMDIEIKSVTGIVHWAGYNLFYSRELPTA